MGVVPGPHDWPNSNWPKSTKQLKHQVLAKVDQMVAKVELVKVELTKVEYDRPALGRRGRAAPPWREGQGRPALGRRAAGGRGPEGWGAQTWKKWGPEGWGAQNFALFLPFPATISLFLCLSGCLLVEFWWCLKHRGPCTFIVPGLRAPAARSGGVACSTSPFEGGGALKGGLRSPFEGGGGCPEEDSRHNQHNQHNHTQPHTHTHTHDKTQGGGVSRGGGFERGLRKEGFRKGPCSTHATVRTEEAVVTSGSKTVGFSMKRRMKIFLWRKDLKLNKARFFSGTHATVRFTKGTFVTSDSRVKHVLTLALSKWGKTL